MPQDTPLEANAHYEMWVYNPYPEDIPLSKLRFAIAYLDAYKRLGQQERKTSRMGCSPQGIPCTLVLPCPPPAIPPLFLPGLLFQKTSSFGA